MTRIQSGAHYAVIGAGLSGLSCARLLAQSGANVTVFEKSRGLGGRLATRRSDAGAFDHGAQYFTARTPAFQDLVRRLQHSGDVARWSPRVMDPPDEPWYVGVPGMSAMAKAVGDGLTVLPGVRVTELIRRQSSWTLAGQDGPVQGVFDGVVVTAPPAQASVLIQAHAPQWSQQLDQIEMQPCWTLMLVTAQLDLPVDAQTMEGVPIGWWARDDSKPGRAITPGQARWVIQASPSWSRAHVNDTAQDVGQALLACFSSQVAGMRSLPNACVVGVHRWLYARRRADQPVSPQSLWDPGLGLGVCGDGLIHSRVEHAFVSGQALARQILALPAQAC